MYHTGKIMSCALGMLGALIALSGCDPVVAKPSPVSELIPASMEAAATPYRIGVGDEVEIKFFFTPELNDRVQVRPDGKISIMFAQDIEAAGHTPEELSAIIKEKLASHIKQLDLVVVVRSFGSQKVFVGGEVSKPGPVLLTGHEDLIQVLDEAGWLTPFAKRDEVILVRRSEDGNEAIFPLNVKKLESGEDPSQNVTIMAGDVILVPPSDAVSLDRWVDQYIRQALPFSTGFVVNHGVGPT